VLLQKVSKKEASDLDVCLVLRLCGEDLFEKVGCTPQVVVFLSVNVSRSSYREGCMLALGLLRSRLSVSFLDSIIQEFLAAPYEVSPRDSQSAFDKTTPGLALLVLRAIGSEDSLKILKNLAAPPKGISARWRLSKQQTALGSHAQRLLGETIEAVETRCRQRLKAQI